MRQSGSNADWSPRAIECEISAIFPGGDQVDGLPPAASPSFGADKLRAEEKELHDTFTKHESLFATCSRHCRLIMTGISEERAKHHVPNLGNVPSMGGSKQPAPVCASGGGPSTWLPRENS